MTGKNTAPTVLGIYLANGILDETAENQGISYTLDHLIFEKLAERIEDTGRGFVYATMQYDHSGFNVICSPEAAEENLSIMRAVLSDGDFQPDLAEEWIAYQRQAQRHFPASVETLYYGKRLSGTPLARSLSDALGRTPASEELIRWHRQYYYPDAFTVCIDGKAAKLPDARKLPQYATASVSLPRHIPWRRSNLILSFDCPITSDQLLAGEALCQWLTPSLANFVNSRNGRLLRVRVIHDFLSELTVSLQCPRGMEQILAEELTKRIRSAAFDGSDSQLDSLRSRVFENYAALTENLLGWNRLAGRAAVIYGVSTEPLLDFDTYRQYITGDRITKLLDTMQSSPSVFAAPVR